MESYYCGGVDTFVINLINNWPNDSDELVLICNKNHSGIEIIRKESKRSCKIISHNIIIFTGFFNKTTSFTVFDHILRILLKIFAPILRYIFLAYNIIALKRVLLKDNPDHLIIINGGYPGGDSCRAAGIAWGIFSNKPRSIHSFHGLVLKPRWHVKIQENIVDIIVTYYTDVFIAVSLATAKLILCRKGIYKKNRIHCIYNGIDIPNKNQNNSKPIHLKSEISIPINSHLCVMLGSYNYNKNFDKGHYFLLKVFKKVLAKIPTAYLLMCGYGSADKIERIRRISVDFNIDRNIRLWGFRKDISHIFKYSDILLISSQTFESFGLTSVEAMAHCVPVVATKVGGIPEIVLNGQGGYCVNKDDVESFARHIITLLEDDELRKEQGQKGFQRYNDLFTAKRMAREYAALIGNK